MLNGIEILSQIPIMDNGQKQLALAVCLIISALIMLFIIVSGFFREMSIVITLLLTMFTIAISEDVEQNTKQPTGKYEYKVTISEDVSFEEFNSKYLIIGQEGKIYTIRERE